MKLNNLQILRGISALMVCCFHFREALNFNNYKWGEVLFSTKKIKHDHLWKNIVGFLKKRIIRIVPLYYFLTFLWIILGGAISYYLEPNNIERLIRSFLFLPQTKGFPVLYLGWSLNYENFFYLIFALILVFRKYRYIAIILFFAIAITLGCLFLPENAFLKMVISTLNIYFIIGILLGLFLHKVQLNKRIFALISISSILIFILFFFNFFSTSSEFVVIIITLLVVSFHIFDFFLKLKANFFLKMLMLVDIFYSIYLSHPFIKIFFRKFHTDSPIFLVLLFILKLAFVILVSKILYELIEKRLTQYLKIKFLPKF